MKRISIFLGLITATTFLFAQQDATTAHETANNFIRQGDYTNALVVLNGAIQKDRDNLELLKDLAFTYYLSRDYSKGLATAKGFPDRADADVQSFQILGLIYKAIEERKDCEKMYRQGIKKFPKSGVLYSEYGEVLGTKDGSEAIKFWEKGIESDPNYSGNYYNACKYYYIKNDKPWSLLYGEIFVNLESYSKRTNEIKDVLAENYKQLFANADLLTKADSRNAFITAYIGINNKEAATVSQGINAQSLTVLRTRFISDWYDKELPKFPFRLFDYHRQLIKDGLFDAYNQWLFGDAQNLQSSSAWKTAHTGEYDRFINFQKGRIFKMPTGQYYQTAFK